MAASTPRVILLEVNGAERPVFDDRVAAAAITPGDLVELTSAGKLTPLAGATKIPAKVFAVEQGFVDAVNSQNIDVAYDANDMVSYVFAQGGDLIYARLAASQTVAVGDVLGPSATAGQLVKQTAPGDVTTIAIAEQAVSTGVGEVKRIKVRIL